MEDSTAMQLKINDLENQIKILSFHTPSISSAFSQSDRIKLNVGGHHFETTLQTLTRYPDSMLSAMFSGKFTLQPDSDGTHFIDRDGASFRSILNFLRDGVVPSNLDKSDLVYLINEAEYFGVTELIKAIHSAETHTSSSLAAVNKVEHIPDFVYEFVSRPMILESVQILVSGDKPFSCEAFLVNEVQAKEHQRGTKISDIVSEEPKWVTSHFSPSIELEPGTSYAIMWSFTPKAGYIYYAVNGSNPQPGRDNGPFTVYGRKADKKWVVESNFYNIRMRVSATEVTKKIH